MSGVEYTLDINEDDIGRFLTAPVNEKKVDSAINRALKKTMRWIGTQTARGLAKELDVLIKSIRKRIFYKFVKNSDGTAGVEVWIGLDDMHANSIGPVRQNKSGVSVRGHHFKSAFLAQAHNGKSYITAFRRASSKNSSPLDEVRNNKNERNQQNPEGHKKWPRYPLKKVGVHIEDDGEHYLRLQERRVTERFYTILQQELNYEFYVKS